MFRDADRVNDMKRCPNCGFSEGTDWPWILGVTATALMFIAFSFGDEPTLKHSVRWLGLVACFLLLSATTWRDQREKRNHKKYLELHQPDPTSLQRLKAHHQTNHGEPE
jgi:hypothetical protein